MTVLGAVAAAAACGVTTGWAAGPMLRRCPEPVDNDGKTITYRALATPRFQAGVGLIAAAATLTACTFVPSTVLPLWLVGATLGVLIAVVDAALTWVPARLSQLTLAGTLLALILTKLLGASWAVLTVTVGAATAVGLTFLLIWRVTYPDLGFADVRFAPVVAAISTSIGLATLFTAVLATTVVAAVQLLIRRAQGRQGIQPYTPAMLAGVFLAAVLAS